VPSGTPVQALDRTGYNTVEQINVSEINRKYITNVLHIRA